MIKLNITLFNLPPTVVQHIANIVSNVVMALGGDLIYEIEEVKQENEDGHLTDIPA